MHWGPAREWGGEGVGGRGALGVIVKGEGRGGKAALQRKCDGGVFVR